MSCELKLVAPLLTLKLTPPSPLTGTGPALSFRTGSALFLTGTDPAYFLGTGPVHLLKTGSAPSLDWDWPRPPPRLVLALLPSLRLTAPPSWDGPALSLYCPPLL